MKKIEAQTEAPTAGMSSANSLIGTEEHKFQRAQRELHESMVEHFKDMDERGCVNKYEKNLLKQGVLFQPIKLAMFGMRPDELREREQHIKNGHGHTLGRPGSGASFRSQKSSRSVSSLGRAPPRKLNDEIPEVRLAN